MPFFSSFTGSFTGGRRTVAGGGGGGGAFGLSATFDATGSFAEGFTINRYGSRLYLKNGAVSNIKQIDLTTEYDLTTATDNGVEKTFTDAGSQGAIKMDASGQQVYIIDDDSGTLRSYLMNPPYDISAAGSTAYQTYSVNGLAFDFSDDRNKLITINGSTITEHSMTTNGRIDTASATGNTFVVPGIGSSWGIAYTPDGSQIWVVDSNTDNITKIDLATRYDLSTATLGDSIDISSITGQPQGLEFSLDGSKVYFMNSSLSVLEYDSGYTNTYLATQLKQVWSNYAGSPAGSSISAGTNITNSQALFIDPNYEHYIALRSSRMDYWQMSPPGSFGALNTSDPSYGFVNNGVSKTATAIWFSADGLRAWTAGVDNPYKVLVEYSLTSAYDLSTATEVQSKSLTYVAGTIYNIQFYNNGSNLLIAREWVGNSDVFSERAGWEYYSLSTPYDISTVSFVEKKYYPNSANGEEFYQEQYRSIAINSDGTKVIGAAENNSVLHFSTLSTPYDISTATFDKRFDFSAGGFPTSGDIKGLHLDASLTKFYAQINTALFEFDIDNWT